MRFRHLAVFTAASALVLATPAYAGPAAADEPTAPSTVDTGQLAAEQALDTVEQVLNPTTEQPAAEAAELPDATMALRDLRLRLKDLRPADRRRAELYFLRPTDGTPGQSVAPYSVPEAPAMCGPHVCIHYVTATSDAPPPGTANGDPVLNDQVETTLAVAENAWTRIVTQGGYAAPRSDIASANSGGDGRLDIYLANIATENQGLYGTCTTDDPASLVTVRFSAYCVIDNDFVEFAPVPPLASLQVTVVHEFFHAVQFAYDGGEDRWLMEGTAAWIEDEIYDSINDNVNYIHPAAMANPLTHPQVSLDRFGASWRAYGVWTFWKKLSERYPAKQGGLPKVLLDVWKKAGGLKRGGASTMALTSVLESYGTSFASFFAKWGVGNRFPTRSYSEGAALHYPAAPLERGFSLSKRKRSLSWKSKRLNHMTNAHYRFKAKGLKGNKWRLRVRVDAPEKVRGSVATLVIYKKSGAIKEVRIRLNKRGDGTKGVPFARSKVKRVELTLTNASNRFKGCYPAQNYSDFTCGGRSKDDHLTFKFRASVVR